jgi:hypothetical protein
MESIVDGASKIASFKLAKIQQKTENTFLVVRGIKSHRLQRARPIRGSLSGCLVLKDLFFEGYSR